MNKKATLRDVIWLAGGGIFLAFFSILLIHFIFTQMFTSIASSEALLPTPAAVDILNHSTVLFNNLDNVIIVVFIGIIISFIMTSWFVAGHPILAVLYFIGGTASILISMLMSNLWEDLTAGTALSTSLAHFPVANHIMLQLPIYITIIWFIGITITLGKPFKTQ